MIRMPQILICDDDQTFHLAIKYSLKGKFECRSAFNTDEALVISRAHPIDIVLLDIQMRTPDEGLQAIPKLREVDPDMAIVMSSGRKDFDAVRNSMRLGAVDYIAKDFEPDDLLHVLSRVMERRTLLQRQEQQNFEVVHQQRKHILVGESPQIISLRKTIDRIRASNANVVIHGETGTGKEVVARQLRRQLADGSLAPFVAVDSATIQSSTAESLLFGHEKGAFTGAEKTTKGIFEEADGGIVYFDEIANMPLDIQAKLLRAIQEREFVRLGSSKVIHSDFRVICATNRDLEVMASQGQFKDDLLQRLNVLPIFIPPLRERAEDIPRLVAHFLNQQSGQSGKLTFTEAAMEILKNYAWPGNIRELGNLISYVVAMTEGTEVDVADLPPKLRDRAKPKPADGAAEGVAATSFYSRIAEYEKRLLNEEYARHEKNISQMSLALGMDRSHLYTKLKEHGIHLPKRGG